MQKTAWQIIKTLSFRDANLCVTLGALVKPLFLAREGMSLQAFTAAEGKRWSWVWCKYPDKSNMLHAL